MSPEFTLAAFMLGALAGLCIYARIDAWFLARKHRRQAEADLNAAIDARTDRMIRAGMRAMTQEEILRLLEGALERKPKPIEPHEFAVTERGPGSAA